MFKTTNSTAVWAIDWS